MQIVLAHPHLSGIGFDLPPVRPVFEAYVRQLDVAHRLRFESGDFLEGPLPGADVLVMGHILHNWGTRYAQASSQKGIRGIAGSRRPGGV